MNVQQLVQSFLKEYNLQKGQIEWDKLHKSKKLSDKRKEIVFSILRQAMKNTECEEKCKFVSVGSESLVSDLDITVTGKKSIDITKEFEKIFKELLGGSPQKVFDTNIYATTFIFEPYEVNYKIIKSKDKTLYFIDNKGYDDRDQHLFALVKIIENCNPVQMKIVEQNISSEILKDSFIKLRELKNDTKSYISELSDIKTLQKKFENAEGEDKLKYGMLLKKHISIANYKSDEAYYTQGSFFHVVGKIQSHYKFLPITKSEYIDSVLENTGFLIENYNKYGIIKEKYVKRIQDALGGAKIKFKFSTNKITDINIMLNNILSKVSQFLK